MVTRKRRAELLSDRDFYVGAALTREQWNKVQATRVREDRSVSSILRSLIDKHIAPVDGD